MSLSEADLGHAGGRWAALGGADSGPKLPSGPACGPVETHPHRRPATTVDVLHVAQHGVACEAESLVQPDRCAVVGEHSQLHPVQTQFAEGLRQNLREHRSPDAASARPGRHQHPPRRPLGRSASSLSEACPTASPDRASWAIQIRRDASAAYAPSWPWSNGQLKAGPDQVSSSSGPPIQAIRRPASPAVNSRSSTPGPRPRPVPVAARPGRTPRVRHRTAVAQKSSTRDHSSAAACSSYSAARVGSVNRCPVPG